jgi:hypothetical protein
MPDVANSEAVSASQLAGKNHHSLSTQAFVKVFETEGRMLRIAEGGNDGCLEVLVQVGLEPKFAHRRDEDGVVLRVAAQPTGRPAFVFLPPEMCRRLPLLLGCSPSPASMTPALTSFSLNLPILAMTFSSGIIPASDSFVALTITMTFIALFSLV